MKESVQKLFQENKHPSDEIVENALKHAIRTRAPEKFLDISDLQDGWSLFWHHAYSGVSLKRVKFKIINYFINVIYYL
jgi:hypothetical protein